MSRLICLSLALLILHNATYSQEKKQNEKIQVPAPVKSAFLNKYSDAKNVTWEKENGNYEANWGGKSGEDNSVMFTPQGNFVEIVKAISVNELPKSILVYINGHYSGSKISEAGRITDAKGKTSYEVEVKGKDIIFDDAGNFIRSEK